MTRNLAFRGIGKVVSGGLHALFAVVLIRSFPPEEYGVYALAVSYTTLFTIFADLGLHVLVTREIARGVEERTRWVGSVATLKLLLMWTAWVAMVLIFPLTGLGNGHTWTLVAITGCFLLADSAMEACQAVAHGFERMELSSLMGVAYRLAMVGAGFLALANGSPISQVVLAMALAGWLVVVGSIVGIRKQLVAFRWSWRAEEIKRLLLEGWPLAISGLFTALYFRLDTVVLAHWASPQEVGWYGAAYKIYETSMMIPALVASVVLPAVAKAVPPEVRAVCLKILWWMGGGALAAGCVGVMGAPWIIERLGANYQPSFGLLRILMVAMPCMWIHHVGGAMVIALRGQRSLAWFTAGCAVVSLVAYGIWIPVGHALAAAWITLATDAVLAGGTLVLLRRFGRAS